MTTDRERRSAPIEVRAQGRRLTGYAALFNTEARIGTFTETIRPGAFSQALDRDVLALVDHDPSKLLARTRSGTLRLSEDSRGLHFDLDTPNTTLGRDILEMAERGDLGGMSFGFQATDEHWQGERRELRSVALYEVSVVSAWPAYQGTIVSARSRAPLHAQIRLSLARRYLESLGDRS